MLCFSLLSDGFDVFCTLVTLIFKSIYSIYLYRLFFIVYSNRLQKRCDKRAVSVQMAKQSRRLLQFAVTRFTSPVL